MKKIYLVNDRGILLVDDSDFDLVSPYRWFLHADNYARGRVNGVLTLVHRLLLNYPPQPIDHINRNGLDNRRSNLRLADNIRNAGNSGLFSNNLSGFRGVSAHRGKWRASLASRHIGVFNTKEEAALAYDREASSYYGEFANLNFPKKSA